MSNDTTYISFNALVDPTTSNALLGTIGGEVNNGVRKIYLMLSTPGGSTAHGITIYNTLRALPVELTTHNTGQVNSIGNVIYLAGEIRYACPVSSFMFHGVGFDIEKTRLEEKHLVEKLDSLRSDQGLLTDIIDERTDINAQEAGDLFLHMAFMNPQEAQSRGFVHEIRDPQVPQGARFLQLVFGR